MQAHRVAACCILLQVHGHNAGHKRDERAAIARDRDERKNAGKREIKGLRSPAESGATVLRELENRVEIHAAQQTHLEGVAWGDMVGKQGG